MAGAEPTCDGRITRIDRLPASARGDAGIYPIALLRPMVTDRHGECGMGGLLEIIIDPSRSMAFGRDAMRLNQVVVTGRGATPVIARDITVNAQVRMRWAIRPR